MIYYECIVIIFNGDFWYIFRALRTETDGLFFLLIFKYRPYCDCEM
jgi:hypothetical protein